MASGIDLPRLYSFSSCNNFFLECVSSTIPPTIESIAIQVINTMEKKMKAHALAGTDVYA
jgi:hypothetical protein